MASPSLFYGPFAAFWGVRLPPTPEDDMVDVIHSPLSPRRALAALEHYVRESRESVLPATLRARGVVDLALTPAPNGFRLRLNRQKGGRIECLGRIAATSSGCALTYEIVDRPSRRIETLVLGAIWLGVLLYLHLPTQQTVSLFAFAAITLTLSAFGTPTGFRVGVYDIFSSALPGSDLPRQTNVR